MTISGRDAAGEGAADVPIRAGLAHAACSHSSRTKAD